jgi:hypothetical protein
MAINFGALSALDTITEANRGSWLTLLDKHKQPSGVRLKLLGTDSDEWRRMDHSDANQRIRAAQKAGKLITLSSEQIEEMELTRLARVTIEWEGIPDESGGIAPCNPTNAYAFYKAFPDAVRQVQKFLQDGAQEDVSFGVDAYMGSIAKNSSAPLNGNLAAAQSDSQVSPSA